MNTNVDPRGDASNVYTSEKFGGIELYAEFMVAAHSKAPLRTWTDCCETQIWGFLPRLLTDQCGAMYHYGGGPPAGQDTA